MQRTKQAASTVDGAREDLSSCVCSRSQSASNPFHPSPQVASSLLSVCLSVCLSHPSPSTTTSHDSPALHSPQHPSHLLNSHARFHPPRCLTSLPAYNLIHSAAHDSTVSPRAHHHHHYHQHPPPPALPTAHETLRLLQSTASLSSHSGNTTPPTLQHEPARAPLNVELAGS